MATIQEIYARSEFAKLPFKGKDKTPIEADGGLDLSKDEKALTKARGGKLSTKKYSDTITQ